MMSATTFPPPTAVRDDSAEPDLLQAVEAAAAGDRTAWNALVRRYTPLITSIARGYRLNEGDVEDVTQTVWMRCYQHLSGLREPRALPGWLKTTTSHEAARLVAGRTRPTAVDPMDLERICDRSADADVTAHLLRTEAHQAVRAGLAELAPDHRRLLVMLHQHARPSYREISRTLGMPTGSIGPTRARCLEKLRGTAALRAYLGGSVGLGETA